MDEPILSAATPTADPITAAPPTDPVIPTDPPVQDPPTDPTPSDPAPFLSIKYNKQEVPLTLEETQTLAQKGMNYEKAIERAKQESRDAYIADQGYMWNGKPITTEADYNRALQEQRLHDQGIDPSIINQVIENHPIVRQAKQTLAQTQKEAFKDKPFFGELEPDIDRMMASNPNLDAQTAYSYLLGEKMLNGGSDALVASLKEENSKLKETLQTRQKNDQNAQSSPGSVTGNGGVPTGYYSKEQVEKMDPKYAAKPEVYKAIMDSMKHWK